MTDSTFGCKSSKKEAKDPDLNIRYRGFGGSLALRSFLVTVLFLVIPLVIYCLMMYRYDAVLKQSEQARSLALVSDVQVFMLEKLTDFELQNLELITLYLQEGALLEDPDKAAANEKLKKIATFERVSEIFVLKKNTERKIECILSSGVCDGLHVYNDIFFPSSLEESDYAIIVDKKKFGEKSKIYFTKVLNRDKQGKVLETLNIAVSTRFFMNYLTDAQGYKDVYVISLFTKKNFVVFDSQDISLVGKKITIDSLEPDNQDSIVLKSLPKESNTYEYGYKDEHLYATILPLAQVDFNILISRKQFDYSYYLKKFFYQTILLFVCIIVFGTLATWFLIHLMAGPLKKLCIVMTNVGNQNLNARYEKSAYGFEINSIGELFNTMIEKLLYNLDKLQKQTIKQEKLQQELQIGHEIQKSLVPTHIPEVPGIEIKTLLIPAQDVGGDFYDFFINPSRPDELLLVMADTAGHGVFGCFYSLTMRSILRSLGSTMTDLKEVIIKANQLFCKDSAESHVFVTTWMASYNHKTHELRYSSCGHPLGFLFRDNRIYKELVTPGIALGVVEDIVPVIDSIELKSGDTLILITDGVIESRNPEGRLLGKDRFIQVVEKYCPMSMVDLFENIIQEIETFEVDPDNQEDDLTMVVIRIK